MDTVMISGATCEPAAFLQNGGTLDDLQNIYHISARRHRRYSNLVQLKYSQIESPMNSPMVQCCRGLILDQDNDWSPVAWPFNKFFNYGEPLAAQIDWPTARVQEKLDGSMMMLYWYDGAWNVGTSGMPDAAGHVHGTKMSFAELFWSTWHEKELTTPYGIYQHFTFIFEMTSPLNRVVVPHAKADLALTGMRSRYTGKEAVIRLRATYNPVREFPLSTIEEIQETFSRMNPLCQEGYVIVDKHFNRIKVKHPGYVALHHLKSSFSVKKLVEIIRTGETPEVLTHFPEWKVPFDKIQAAYDGLVTHLEQNHDELMEFKEDRRSFALAAQHSPCPSVHFNLLDGKRDTVKDALSAIHIDRMVDLLGVRGLVLESEI